MSNWGIKVSKERKNVQSCGDKDLILSSKFDTLKIGFSGRLTLNYPDWNYNYTGTPISQIDTIYFEHNLGYIPYYTPRCVMEAPDYPETYINEIVRGQPLVSYSPPSWQREYIDVYTTTTRLYIKVTREYNYDIGPISGTWEGGTVYMDYTIFRNSLSEEFNLLE